MVEIAGDGTVNPIPEGPVDETGRTNGYHV